MTSNADLLARIAALDPRSPTDRGRLMALRREAAARRTPGKFGPRQNVDRPAPDSRIVELIDARLATPVRQVVAAAENPLAGLPGEAAFEARPLREVDLRQLDALPADPAAWSDDQARHVERLWRTCRDDADRRHLATWRAPLVALIEARDRAARTAQAEAQHAPVPPLAGPARALAEAVLADQVAAEAPEIEEHADLVARERLTSIETAAAEDRGQARAAALADIERFPSTAVPRQVDLDQRPSSIETGRQMARAQAAPDVDLRGRLGNPFNPPADHPVTAPPSINGANAQEF